jgi:outer membrane biosynthesis protein TonB
MIKVSVAGLLLLLANSPDAACQQNPANGPQQTHDGNSKPCSEDAGCKTASGAEILSDTKGVDFGPYIQQVMEAIKRRWLPLIPPVARPPVDKQGRNGIRFKIYPDGRAKELILEHPSGDISLDRAAWGGITGASPYQPLPKQFTGPYLELRFGFNYNLADQHPAGPQSP